MTETKTTDAGASSALRAGSVRPFAVLRLTDLHVYRFDHKDEMMEAIRAMRERGVGFVPLIDHPSENTYVVPETWQ